MLHSTYLYVRTVAVT